LIAAGLVVIWISNAVRIAALILIGVAGFPNVAVNGFHSQAGWIAFNGVALGFALVSRRLPWFTHAAPAELDRVERNATAPYLVPFLAILAAAMISRAASGGFEWLYPLRFVAAAAALWFFRKEYVALNWRSGPLSVGAGVAVFAMWLGLEGLAGPHGTSGIASGWLCRPWRESLGWCFAPRLR
jgi:hypothetical protein